MTDLFVTTHPVIETDKNGLVHITGEKFELCLVVDGIAFRTAWNYGDEQIQQQVIERVRNGIRDAQVEVRK